MKYDDKFSETRQLFHQKLIEIIRQQVHNRQIHMYIEFIISMYIFKLFVLEGNMSKNECTSLCTHMNKWRVREYCHR